MQHLADGHDLVGFQHWRFCRIRICYIRIRRRIRVCLRPRSSRRSSSHVVHPLGRLLLVVLVLLVRVLLSAFDEAGTKVSELLCTPEGRNPKQQDHGDN